MFKRLFGGKEPKKPNPEIRMPEVDELANIEVVFAKAREAATGAGQQPPGVAARHVVVITPGRMLMFQPCPPPGSMPDSQVATIEKMISPKVQRNIAAIAYTELGSTKDMAKNIPFLGILIGFAYIGHAVWVFEGHPSALAAGCKDADVLIVDSGMIPCLQKDWLSVAAGVMRMAEIYVHDRVTYSLSKVVQ